MLSPSISLVVAVQVMVSPKLRLPCDKEMLSMVGALFTVTSVLSLALAPKASCTEMVQRRVAPWLTVAGLSVMLSPDPSTAPPAVHS